LRGTAAVSAISVLEWLAYFKQHGVPGTSKDWGIAEARAQAAGPEDDRYLVYWYCEGGWDSYSLFSPLATGNNSAIDVPYGELNPSPRWSDQRYRSPSYVQQTTVGNIEHGYLGADARDMFNDMCVLSSLRGNTFHSGGRWQLHYGEYGLGYNPLQDARGADERTVMQAFAEAKGASFLMPNVGWHRWLADGELDLNSYPVGTGYYERLGPAYAHTNYGRTTADLRQRLTLATDGARLARRAALRGYTDDLHANFLRGRDGQSVRSFAAALQQYRDQAEGNAFDVSTLFNDNALREQFGIRVGDDETSETSVNEQPARSKEIPHIRVQSMMAYELMRARLSCGLFLENRDIRGFDYHRSRGTVLDTDANSDQRDILRENVWDPLRIFVNMLKSTPAPNQTDGSSLYDRTTIVLCSEMGRTLHGDVEGILADGSKSNDQKYNEILGQDVCQHWHVNSCVFMGGNVQAGRQFGRVGASTMDIIPVMPDGSLDPAFNATTGVGDPANMTGFIPNEGHVYSTALDLAGVSPTGKGRNVSPALSFIKRR
jgi:hypothetical protein